VGFLGKMEVYWAPEEGQGGVGSGLNRVAVVKGQEVIVGCEVVDSAGALGADLSYGYRLGTVGP
jgi:hypothetical protein